MKPSKKSKEITDFLENMASRTTAIQGNFCVAYPIGCEKAVDINAFKDELSKKEYTISGLCQDCQDKIFRGLLLIGDEPVGEDDEEQAEIDPSHNFIDEESA